MGVPYILLMIEILHDHKYQTHVRSPVVYIIHTKVMQDLSTLARTIQAPGPLSHSLH